MTKKCRRYFRKLFDCAPIILGFQLVDDLDVEPEYAKGVHKAIAKVAPFFWPQFLWSKDGEPFRNSLMFNQAERAKDFPDIRSHVSNKYRSPEFFKEFEDAMTRVGGNLADLPPEWDLHMRPIIAHRRSPCQSPWIFLTTSQCISVVLSAADHAPVFKAKQLQQKNQVATNMMFSSTGGGTCISWSIIP